MKKKSQSNEYIAKDKRYLFGTCFCNESRPVFICTKEEIKKKLQEPKIITLILDVKYLIHKTITFKNRPCINV